MGIWRSPVFYFGVVLLLAVASALIAPFVIDWNRYKADLERYGERLTGRIVHIEGPVSVRLFPFPRLQAERVALTNTDDPSSGTFAEAEKLVVRIALDGLFAGEVRVEDITFERPIVSLRRGADGSVNWMLSPQEQIRNSRLLDKVRLDRITVNSGTIHYLNEVRGTGYVLEDLTASFSAPSIEGPWRSEGLARYAERYGKFTFTSGAYVPGEPVRVGFRLTPQSTILPSIAFDGAADSAALKGKVRLEPQPPPPEVEKGDPEGTFRPLAMQGDLEFTGETAALTGIKITPSDVSDGSTLIEGDMRATIGDQVVMDATFDAPRLNLDAVFGAKTTRAWRTTGALGLLDGVIARLPPALQLNLRFTANTLTAASDTLENVEIAVDAGHNALRVKRISAVLPGRTRVLADGIVFANTGQADFGGKLALETTDLRRFSRWMFPESAKAIEAAWTGARGQVKLQSNLNWSAQRLAFSDAAFELDGSRGSGSASFTLGASSAADIRLALGDLNLDTYLPGGIRSAGAGASDLTWQGMASGLFGFGSEIKSRITFAADSLLVNGVTARGVQSDVDIGADGLRIRSFSLGSVGGAQVTASGAITRTDGTYEGSVSGGLSAEDPRAFLQLVGLADAGKPAAWVNVLGATNVTSSLVFTRGESEPLVSLAIEGRSGPLQLSLTNRLRDFASPDGPSSQGVLQIESANGADIARLFGVPALPHAQGGTLVAGFDGRRGSGFNMAVKAEALDGTLTFKGTYQPASGPVPAVSGRLAVNAERSSDVFAAFGVPMIQPQPVPLSLEAEVKPELEALRISAIKGTLGAGQFTGDIAMLNDGSVTADISGGNLALADVFAASVLAWDGAAASLDQPFGDGAPFGLSGEFWYRPATLMLTDTLPLSEAVVGLMLEGKERQLSIAGRSRSGDTVTLETRLKPAAGQYELAVNGKLPFDMSTALMSKDGKPILSGAADVEFKASGNGLTPVAALSDLVGEGTATLREVALLDISPEVFVVNLSKVASADDLKRALASLQGGGQVALGNNAHKFTIAAGRASLAPFVIELVPARLSVTAEADLVDRNVAATARLQIKQPADLPTVDLVASGPPHAVQMRVETSALAAKLGYDIMAREMAELERVQAEQQRVIEQEEAQRKLDEEKFKAYQEQRAELRLRQRELRVFAAQRALDAELAKQALAAQADDLNAMSKADIGRRLREARIMRVTANGGFSKPVKSKRREPLKIDDLPEGFDLPGLGMQDGSVPAQP